MSAKDRYQFDMFYGVASGQQRSALRRLEPEALMISYATANNKPWDGDYKLFIDSGGYHHMAAGTGEYDRPVEDYIDYLREVEPDLWAFRDYPCEPRLLEKTGRSVEENQRLTTEAAARMMPLADGVPGQPVVVIQGWTREQYLAHLRELESLGLLTDYVGIGSICRRNSDLEIADVILSIRDALPDRCKLHAFGVKGSVLKSLEVVKAVDSVDSGAYDWAASRFPDERPTEAFTWRDSARAYLNWRHETLAKAGTYHHQNEWYQSQLNAVADGGFSEGEEVCND